MASFEPQDLKTRFEALSAGAQLDILVPTSPDFDPTTLFHDGLPGRLSSAPSRRNLYFDEITQLNLILRTSLGERAARSILGSVEVVLAAHATDAVPQGQGNAASASGKHDLTQKTISGLEISSVLFAGEQTYMIWKPTLHISRPRVRLQRPAVYFTASLGLTSPALNTSASGRSDLLDSFEPLPENVLEPLRFDTAFAGSEIYLPEDRITKVLPASATVKDEVKPIRGATKRAFPIVPALFTRIRYSTLPDSLVASLHLEVSHLVAGSVAIKEVKLSTEGAEVRRLTNSSDPERLAAGVELVKLYKLMPKSDMSTKSLPISVRAEVVIHTEQGSSAELDTSWQATIDFTKVPLNPTYRWSRPLSGGPTQPPGRQSLQAGPRPPSVDLAHRPSPSEAAVVFNFTALSTVTAGQDFSLDVHCINRSSRARRFALVVLHPRRHTSSHARDLNVDKANAELVASVFNAPFPARTKQPDVLDLNPDVRIGPLPAGAIFETQMKFRAVATGPLDLGVVRIVDLDTRQTIDVRELPDVTARASAKTTS